MKNIISHVFPFRLKTYHSKINGRLEVNLINGRKTLDTPKSNYSYGSLQKILHQGLIEIGFPTDINRVLVLGLGGGSIVQTIREDFGSDVFIELVDIDSEIISIAINDFDVKNFGNVNITHSDAIDYLQKSRDVFDLIIVDVFIIDTIPEAFTNQNFINSLPSFLTQNGKIIYNTIRQTITQEVFNGLVERFKETGFKVKVLEKVEFSNNLIIAELVLL